MSDDPDGDRMRAVWNDIQRERRRRADNIVALIIAVVGRDITARTGWRIWRLTRRDPALTVVLRTESR